MPQALLEEIGKILGRFLATEGKLTQDETEHGHDLAPFCRLQGTGHKAGLGTEEGSSPATDRPSVEGALHEECQKFVRVLSAKQLKKD